MIRTRDVGLTSARVGIYRYNVAERPGMRLPGQSRCTQPVIVERQPTTTERRCSELCTAVPMELHNLRSALATLATDLAKRSLGEIVARPANYPKYSGEQ